MIERLNPMADLTKNHLKIRIMIAEDHALVREVLRQLVSRQPDMEIVGEAEDGEAVLHHVVAEQLFQRLSEATEVNAPEKAVCALTAREMEVLRLATDGMSNEKIAGKIMVGSRTVQTHWRNIFNKLGVNSRTEAVICALRNGWIKLEDAEGD